MSRETNGVSPGARRVVIAAVVSLAALLFGPLSVRLGLLEPLQAFLSFVLALFVGLFVLVGGIIVLVRRRTRRRGLVWTLVATGYSVLLLSTTAVIVLSTRHLPAINDITTDPQDSPRFPPKSMPAKAGAQAYPQDFAEKQRRAYPGLDSIVLPLTEQSALERARAAAERLGWNVKRVDARAGLLLATERSTLFRFVDDIVVRVRADPDGKEAVIDVRSRSRDGRGDLGVNAERIREFERALLR